MTLAQRVQGMEQVIALAEAGSFHAAAARLGVTPSALGKAIAALEDRLGVRLFHRTTRRVALSEEGAQFLDHCRRVSDEVDEAERVMAEGAATLAGIVRIGGPVAYTRLRVLPKLLPFLAEHPDLRLDLRQSDRVLDPLEDRLDLVVRIGTLADSGMRARKLDTIHFGAFAAPDYLARTRPIAEPRDLEGQARLGFTTVDGRALPWAFERDGVRHVLPPADVMASTDAETLVDAARAGLGVFYGPTFLAEAATVAGDLVPVLPHWSVTHAPVHVLTPRPDRVPRRVTAVVEALMGRG